MGCGTIDVIIINYQSTNVLAKCLESIYQTLGDSDVGVWVWDNNSEDTPSRLSGRFPKMRLTNSSKNIGFSEAVNKGIFQSKASYVMLLNPDAFIKDNFFSIVMAYMDAHQEIGVLGPKIINPDESLQESARSFPNLFTGAFLKTLICMTWNGYEAKN